jgi:hypothetical protein
MGFVRLIVLMNNTVIKPAQTESSNTAARCEPNLNMITESIMLTIASDIAARRSVPRITAHIEKKVIKANKIMSITKVTSLT